MSKSAALITENIGQESHLIMTPREHDVFQATMRLIDAVFARVDRVLRVWVVGEGVWVDAFIRECASYDESVLRARAKSVQRALEAGNEVGLHQRHPIDLYHKDENKSHA